MQNSQQISLREAPIPKEAPWKTLVLNEQFRKKRGCEFSTTTSGTERERGFVGIVPSLKRKPRYKILKTPISI